MREVDRLSHPGNPAGTAALCVNRLQPEEIVGPDKNTSAVGRNAKKLALYL